MLWFLVYRKKTTVVCPYPHPVTSEILYSSSSPFYPTSPSCPVFPYLCLTAFIVFIKQKHHYHMVSVPLNLTVRWPAAVRSVHHGMLHAEARRHHPARSPLRRRSATRDSPHSAQLKERGLERFIVALVALLTSARVAGRRAPSEQMRASLSLF